MPTPKASGLQISKIYVSRVRFEHAAGSLPVPNETATEKLSLDLSISGFVAQDEQSAAMTLLVRTSDEPAPHYRFEVEIVAILKVVEPEPAIPLPTFVKRSALTLMYPFAREVIANITMRGRFGTTFVNPIIVEPDPEDVWQVVDDEELAKG
jgi:preprotein translocase subunit SecB